MAEAGGASECTTHVCFHTVPKHWLSVIASERTLGFKTLVLNIFQFLKRFSFLKSLTIVLP